MSRPSPSAQRIIAILDFLADHPGTMFSLTDLIRALKMNRATCHGLVAELVEHGYVYRSAEKLYALGPSIVRLGRAASQQLSPLQIALPEMRLLADHYDVVCAAIFRSRNDVIVRERAASLSHLGSSTPRGARWPLRPPFGAIFLAWSKPEEAEAWLDELDPAPSMADRQWTKAGMGFARAHGFQFVIRALPEDSLQQSGEWLTIGDPADRPLRIGTELNSGEAYRLASMSSPVFDAKGKVAFVLGLSGFSGERNGSEIEAIAHRLRELCARVTEFMPI